MMNTVVGMVYFEDYKEMIPWHTVLFGTGVVITLFGVFLLSKRDPSSKPPKGFGQLQEEGGYIEEVVSSLDDSEIELVTNSSFVKDDSDRGVVMGGREESDVRQPFISSSSTSSLMKGGFSSSGLPEAPSTASLSPPSTADNNKPTMGDVEDEEEAVGMDNLGETGPHPVHHPPTGISKNVTRSSHSRSFSLSWSWWARGGTRKLYTPLF